MEIRRVSATSAATTALQTLLSLPTEVVSSVIESMREAIKDKHDVDSDDEDTLRDVQEVVHNKWISLSVMRGLSLRLKQDCEDIDRLLTILKSTFHTEKGELERTRKAFTKKIEEYQTKINVTKNMSCTLKSEIANANKVYNDLLQVHKHT